MITCRTPAEIQEAAQLLRSLMEALYAGATVRTPEEFKGDLRGLRIAAEVLEELHASKA